MADAELGPRVKFQCSWVAPITTLLNGQPELVKLFSDTAHKLADALWELEEVGVTPVCADGRVGGNASALFPVKDNTYLIVSKSGKLAKHKMDIYNDFCIITSFDADKWSAEYYALSDEVLPTSDTPLHYMALKAHSQFGWSGPEPHAILHGHALETEEKAQKLGFPISTEITLFSTKEDAQAILVLMKENPYPENKVFIRKGHGFLLLGNDVDDGVDCLRKTIVPFLNQ